MNTRSSSSLSPPLLREEGGELQTVDHALLRRHIPPGWSVIKRRRSSAEADDGYGRVDTYYVEPETGRHFPSLASVHRHLNGEQSLCLALTARKHSDGPRLYEKLTFKELTVSKQMHRTVEYASPDFSLPDGWLIKAIPRRNSTIVDKYYIEPETGTRFRSLISVERYLKSMGNSSDEPQVEPLTVNVVPFGDHSPLVMNRNDTDLRDNVTHQNRPEKVKWVLTGPGGNMFRPYINGSAVSGSVRDQWSEAFVSLIQDRS
ncbi:PREDICTED: methyl-CpG-binding domain-containing protein 7 isoform X2 [Tarenaya hassleriana]|uniref:methyl-CpG-binding domain-containing protein 7 isoform X2 n=1 Tax=Tarenaya hassleriana TaxID=28532 RepID=UPI00053C3217|nr:PREDICTED: methyl-CpG-binding domain-containing protein 7 isoform X2 [Tarenaya hassleriana]